MEFAGRWVPMEVMNAFFMLWGIAALALGAVVWWLWRKGPPARPKDKLHQASRRRKHRRGKA
jgi:hypothetical protein